MDLLGWAIYIGISAFVVIFSIADFIFYLLEKRRNGNDKSNKFNKKFKECSFNDRNIRKACK